MAEHKSELIPCFILGRALQLLPEHPEGRSDHDSGEIVVLEESIVILIEILHICLVVTAVL